MGHGNVEIDDFIHGTWIISHPRNLSMYRGSLQLQSVPIILLLHVHIMRQ